MWSRFVVTPASHELLPIFTFGSSYTFQDLCLAISDLVDLIDKDLHQRWRN
jgi:hypothetical protein